MVPSKKRILKDLDSLAAACNRSYEQCKAAAFDPARSPTERDLAAHAARRALDKHRDYAALAEQLRAGLLDRHDDNFLSMYSG